MYSSAQKVAIKMHGLSKTFFGAMGEVMALKNVTCSIEKGTCVGIIGHNGSGKSTLLRLLAGLSLPSSGFAVLKGRMASVLDIGIGFHPDLNGWDNLHFSAQLLGLSKKELRPRIPSIVAFSGIEKYMHRPLKQYSHGMFLRLAFAIATEVNADILLFDEILSVGDASFQQKCRERIQSLKAAGKTLIMVSHDLQHILQFADKYLVLANGELQHFSDNPNSIATYVQEAQKQAFPYSAHLQAQRVDALRAQMGISIKHISSQNHTYPEQNDQKYALGIHLKLHFLQAQMTPNLVFHIHNFAGHTISTFSSLEVVEQKMVSKETSCSYQCMSPGIRLTPGSYALSLYLVNQRQTVRFHIPYLHHFLVKEQSTAQKALLHGPFQLNSHWQTEYSSPFKIHNYECHH